MQVAIIDAEVRHGMLLLRPGNVLVLGGKVRLSPRRLRNSAHNPHMLLLAIINQRLTRTADTCSVEHTTATPLA